jgi:hypothetical protein
MVEHLVLFKLHEGTSEGEKQAVIDALQGLSSIDGIVEMSVGKNHSEEGKSKGFEIGMRIGFRDQAALDAYLPSEQHQSTVNRIKEHFADVIVFDYTW